jgi:hypothetical protein
MKHGSFICITKSDIDMSKSRLIDAYYRIKSVLENDPLVVGFFADCFRKEENKMEAFNPEQNEASFLIMVFFKNDDDAMLFKLRNTL